MALRDLEAEPGMLGLRVLGCVSLEVLMPPLPDASMLQGVVDGPASAVSALMYKDESTVPMFHVLVAELFRSVLGSLNTELDVMRFITEVLAPALRSVRPTFVGSTSCGGS